MIVAEGIRDFQKNVTQYLNADDVVFLQDAKTHKEKGVYLPFRFYEQFREQIRQSIREEVKNSFNESFDGAGIVHER